MFLRSMQTLFNLEPGVEKCLATSHHFDYMTDRTEISYEA